MQYRQGDVFLVAIDALPESARKSGRRGRVTLALGEATGHSHVLERGQLYMTDEEVDRRFVEIVEASDLVHEEHDTITVPPGLYEVRRQREYAPGAIRYVAD